MTALAVSCMGNKSEEKIFHFLHMLRQNIHDESHHFTVNVPAQYTHTAANLKINPPADFSASLMQKIHKQTCKSQAINGEHRHPTTGTSMRALRNTPSPPQIQPQSFQKKSPPQPMPLRSPAQERCVSESLKSLVFHTVLISSTTRTPYWLWPNGLALLRKLARHPVEPLVQPLA